MRASLLLCLFLAGCPLIPPGQHFMLSEPSCDEDFLDWHGGLTRHLLQGAGTGRFDYDPAGALVTQVQGEYDLETGDFTWEEAFHSDHWRESRQAEGYGYAQTNGDLDIAYTLTTTDINEDRFAVDVRDVREGCDVTRRLSTSEVEVWHFGTYDGGVYEYRDEETVQGAPWVVEGVLEPSGDWVESLDFSTTGLSYVYEEEGDDAGYSIRDWVQTQEGTAFEGYTERFVDGTEHTSYEYMVDGERITWEYTVDYDGNGEGSVAGCDLDYVEFECFITCPGSSRQSC